MKKIVFIFMTIIAIFAITNCKDPDDGENNIYKTGSTRKFWAQNAVTQTFYQLDAEKLAENSRCVVWAEKGSGVTVEKATNIANEYANNIYTKMMDTFGWSKNIQLFYQVKNMNTMEIAHYYATGNSNNAKLTILLLDIKDGYQSGVNESFVTGYFWAYDILSNLLPSGYKSNELDMLYIDTNPGINKRDISEVYLTLAHEMQHLMNFVSSIAYRVNDNMLYLMDLWIDEGLSSAAEWVYSGDHSMSRVEWFNSNGIGDDRKGKIDVGNNFYVWGNRVTNSDAYPLLDDYATVYLFFQWLRLQSNKDIYKEIIKSDKFDYHAVITAFNNKKTTGAAYSDWDSMLKDWLAANSANSLSGRDGYKNDPTLKDIKAHYAPAGTTTFGLYPGEGVYSYADTAPSLSQSGNIKYYYFSGNKTLLTYNINTINYNENIVSLIENGQTTGIKPPASIGINISGNFDLKLGSSKISGPFPVSMGDVIRINKNNNALNFDITPIERVFIDE
jgi:hypothetical protein